MANSVFENIVERRYGNGGGNSVGNGDEEGGGVVYPLIILT